MHCLLLAGWCLILSTRPKCRLVLSTISSFSRMVHLQLDSALISSNAQLGGEKMHLSLSKILRFISIAIGFMLWWYGIIMFPAALVFDPIFFYTYITILFTYTFFMYKFKMVSRVVEKCFIIMVVSIPIMHIIIFICT